MEDQATTLNDGSDAVVLFDSSPDSPVPAEETADSPAEAQNTDTAEQEAEAAGESGTEVEAEEEAKEENVRFDQHPRFQELIKGNKALKDELAAIKAQLESSKPQEVTDFDAKFTELDEKLAEGDIDLPEFNKQTRALMKEQAAFEQQRAAQQAQEQTRTRELQDKFLSEHGYLNDLLQSRSDDIEALIDANPLHDQVSAAMELHIKELEAGKETAIQAAVEKAVKEKEQEMLKNFKAKQSARSLGEGARSAEPDENAVLKDTSKRGGLKNVLAERLAAKRKAV